MKRLTGLGMVVGALLMLQSPAWAARTKVHEAAESQQYGRKFGGMIGRGLLNAATCFVDVIVNIVNETKDGPPFVGTVTGVAKGASCGVLRLGSGAVDLVTFWVPGFNGFPVSDSYEDCLAAGTSAEIPMSGETLEGATEIPGHVPSEPAQPKKTWKK